jgi:hypothetical protein
LSSNILSTWLCVDSAENATYFPSSKGMSSDNATQAKYYKCVAVCLHSARLYNPDIKLAFFSNKKELPIIEGVDLEQLFKALDVQFYHTDFEYVTPKDYSAMWRNQFYEFSILKFIGNCPDFSDDDNLVLIDSDCVITRPLDEIFDKIKEHKSITYALDYSEDVNINGISRNQMHPIFSELAGKPVEKIPVYYAGEFFGATVEMVKKYFGLFSDLWLRLLELNAAGKPKLVEEAHVFSFLFYITNTENDIANKYVKRLWTDPSSFRNVEPGDENLYIWHLPKHKVQGFPWLFKFWSKKDFSTTALSANEYYTLLKKLFTIPDMGLKNKLYFGLRKTAKRILVPIMAKTKS